MRHTTWKDECERKNENKGFNWKESCEYKGLLSNEKTIEVLLENCRHISQTVREEGNSSDGEDEHGESSEDISSDDKESDYYRILREEEVAARKDF